MGGGKKSEKSEKSEKKSSGEKPHEIRIKRARSGGYTVTHHGKHKPGMDEGDTDPHVITDAEQLQNHVQDTMGDQPPAGTPAPDPNAQAAASQAGAPPSPAGM
jgi:hypothetical protein